MKFRGLPRMIGITGVAAAAAVGPLTALMPIATAVADEPFVVPTAYVTNSQQHSVSVYTGGRLSGTIFHVGPGPVGIATTPDGATAYVADYGFFNQVADTITPIDLAQQKAGSPIRVGTGPLAIAITPNGQDALVTLQGTAVHPGHQVVEVNLATHAVSAPIAVGVNPESLAIAPDGNTAYVAAFSSAEVTPIDLQSSPPRAEPPIVLPANTFPRAIAVSPDGTTAYVLDTEGSTIIPISLPQGKVGTPVDLVCRMQGDPGCTPTAIAIAPNGRTAYVAAAGSADVMMLALPSLTVAGVLATGGYPDAVGWGDGWLFVADGASNATTVFHGLRAPMTVAGGIYPFGVAVVTPADAAATRPGPPLALPSRAAAPVSGSPLSPRPSAPARPFYGFPPA